MIFILLLIIYLYDTFGYTNGNSPDFYELEDDLNSRFDSPDYLPNFIVEPPTYPAFYTIMGGPTLKKAVYEDYIYNSLETYDFGAKTQAGKLLESIRGRDEIHTVKFGDKNRVRVNFYDASYIVYAALGVSVQMQTKNWVGWGQINADELRIGWDVLEYNAGSGLSFTPTKVGYINPNTIPPHYTTDIPGSNHKFEIFDLSVLGFRLKPIVSYNDRKLLQIAIKEAYDLSRRKLSPAESKSLENIPSAYVTLANGINDDRIVTVDPDEERSTFNKKMSRTFDWRTGTFTLKYNSQTGLSGSGEIAKSFELNKASIYGIAKYANQWKGVRIIKK